MKIELYNLLLNSISFKELIDEIINNAKKNIPSYFCAVNVHMTVEAQKDDELKNAINSATWAGTDGVPILWSFNFFNKTKQSRLAGMDLTPFLLNEANSKGLIISVYGNTKENLQAFKTHIELEYPFIKIGALISPPFRTLNREEQEKFIDEINTKKSQIVFVSLGCPKQEKWMLRNSYKINAVCLGIGNAINTTIGKEKRPHKIFQQLGLEWMYRLIQNPKRLFKRYLITNTKFCFMFFRKLIVK